jgi:conjugal transfer pilus assembly protein TraL
MVRIPRYIDTQPQILWWELDEVILLVLSLFAGILTRQLTYFLLGGFVATYFVSKLKSGKSKGYVFHWFYWLGIPSFQFRSLPPGHRREFLE